MSTNEIAYQVEVMIQTADNAFKAGNINAAGHAELVRAAYDWKRKAECGYWDCQAYRQGA